LKREYEQNEGYAPLPMFSESDQTLCRRFRGKRRQKVSQSLGQKGRGTRNKRDTQNC
jgi:hypothetical protein